MFFSAAAEGSAPNVVPQLLYKFWVLLLYLLSKLLPPVTERHGHELQDFHLYSINARIK